MLKAERIRALRQLARIHPTAEQIGFWWKNPKSRGIRWTKKDLELFRQFQNENLNTLDTLRANMD
jgi:hypothetical protein